ncbi:hypothetical protein NAEGRDRAFT_80763 [Naegleria gruberi]|uniref:Uncharacterized protein n=1 Tax=Naegleria gruberi TaxID=5762 RepID=D2VPJ5_NAEGR|nr:uncharacterized protein NAEGRDRAFT_80763 [Naegleria gruberi]EFC41219.1 hypothetical protein NAEGRDRAFT_80763 [Naegleria gruberi]|eukprot:XP_002673963.1 hypothetical protein NAEGRDRAFT_80763 [Naegleria gruberi strain NEG-M]
MLQPYRKRVESKNGSSTSEDPREVVDKMVENANSHKILNASIQKDNQSSKRFTERDLSKICLLVNLQHLDLTGHCIQALPSNITNLANLRTLVMNKSELVAPPKNFELLEPSLTDVQFRLNNFKDWPIQLNKINLQRLDLSFNRLNKISVSSPNLSSFIFGERSVPLQTSLRELNLSYNYFTNFPTDLLKFSALEKLDLTKNDLVTLPDLGKMADTLKELMLEGCGFTTFPITICNLLNLKVLNVSNNEFEWFPQTQGLMSQLSQLSELYANSCKLHGWSQLFCQAKLVILQLSNNKIRGVPTEVRTLSLLEELVLSKNFITHIPEHFSEFVNLVYLDLSENNIEDIDPAFGNLKKLEIFKLKSNRLFEIPDELCELESLKEIDLSENDLKKMFDCSKMTNLERLDVTYNYLEEFPKIGGCKNLTSLDLTMNRLRGAIPDYFYDLVNLRNCKLKHNSLESLDAKICNLVELETLNLDNNEILSIPEEVMLLKKLKNFSIINNYELKPQENIKKHMEDNDIVFQYTYEEPSKIRDYLFLSSAPPAGSRRLLKSLNVSHVITIAKDIPPRHKNDFKYMVIFAEDTNEASLRSHFEETREFINEAKKQGTACMVHCMAGVSRSTARSIQGSLCYQKYNQTKYQILQ